MSSHSLFHHLTAQTVTDHDPPIIKRKSVLFVDIPAVNTTMASHYISIHSNCVQLKLLFYTSSSDTLRLRFAMVYLNQITLI